MALGDKLRAVMESDRAVANGVATLDSNSRLVQMPTAAEVGARADTWTPTADEVGARPDTWTPTAAEVGVSNRNLLDNWYWANPINQRGNTTYSNCIYTIDRWKYAAGNSNYTLTVNDGYCTLANSNTGGYSYFVQEFEKSLDASKTYTASVCIDNVIYSRTYSGSSGLIDFQPITGFLVYGGISSLNFRITAGMSVNISKLKVELGSVSTLAYDAPPNYAEELAKCMRYFQRTVMATQLRPSITLLRGSGNQYNAQLDLPVKLRDYTSNMTFSGDTAYLAVNGNGLNIPVSSYSAGAASNSTVFFTVTTDGSGVVPYYTPCYLALSAVSKTVYIDVSADL